MLTKQYSQEVLVFCFNWEKSVAEEHRMLVQVYGNFSVIDKPRCGQPKKFEDKELEALLNEDPTQTQEELANTLGVTQQAVSVRLKSMGMIQKQGNWVPYELKSNYFDR